MARREAAILRRRQGESLDLSTGVEMFVRVGDRIEAGQPLARLFSQPADEATARTMLIKAITLAEEPTAPLALIVDRIT